MARRLDLYLTQAMPADPHVISSMSLQRCKAGWSHMIWLCRYAKSWLEVAIVHYQRVFSLNMQSYMGLGERDDLRLAASDLLPYYRPRNQD